MEYTQYQFWCKTNFTLDQTPPPLPPQPPPYWASSHQSIFFWFSPFSCLNFPGHFSRHLKPTRRRRSNSIDKTCDLGALLTYSSESDFKHKCEKGKFIRSHISNSKHVFSFQHTSDFNLTCSLLWFEVQFTLVRRAVYFSSTCSLL